MTSFLNTTHDPFHWITGRSVIERLSSSIRVSLLLKSTHWTMARPVGYIDIDGSTTYVESQTGSQVP